MFHKRPKELNSSSKNSKQVLNTTQIAKKSNGKVTIKRLPKKIRDSSKKTNGWILHWFICAIYKRAKH